MSTKEQIRTRITELLEVYPKLSPTMLQAGLGPSLGPDFWRPVFNEMIDEGFLTQTAVQPPLNRSRSRPYTVIQFAVHTDLSNVKVPPPPGNLIPAA